MLAHKYSVLMPYQRRIPEARLEEELTFFRDIFDPLTVAMLAYHF